MINILESIPRGEDNAITRTELVNKLGISDRRLRRLIHKKREEGELIISKTSGKGYYQPETREEVVRFIRQQKSYIKNLHRSISKAEKALRVLPEQTNII